ncbi:hypothetical protein D3C81_1146980 [compost metagenome]
MRDPHGTLHRCIRLLELHGPLALGFADAREQCLDGPLDAGFVEAVPPNDGTAFSEVGSGKARCERQRQHALLLQRFKQPVDALSRLHHRGHAVDRYQERHASRHQVRTRLPPAQLQQHLGGPFAGGGHVHVRIGAIRHPPIRQREHPFGDVGMQIQRDHDLHVRTGRGTDARQQLALAVVEVLGHHGAMQVEIDRVVRGRHHRLHDLAGDALVGIGRDMRRSARSRPDHRRDGVTVPANVVDEAADRHVHVQQVVDRLAAHHRGKVLATDEALVGGHGGGERIGFVLKTGY